MLRTLLAGALVLSATVAMAQPEPPPDGSVSADRAYQTARALYDSLDYEHSLRWLRYAHRKEPRAAFLFGIGRTLEAMGRLKEAHQAYRDVLARPRLGSGARKQARAAIERLAPLIDQVMVRFRDLPDDVTLQLDGRVLPDLRAEQALKPGPHQLCVRQESPARLRCWRRELPSGHRVDWPPKGDRGVRGALVLPTDGSALRSLDGLPMLLDVRNIAELELDVGTHEVVVAGADGKTTKREVDLRPGSPVRLGGEPDRQPSQPDQPAHVGVGVAVPFSPPHRPNPVAPWILQAGGIATLASGAVLLVVQTAIRSGLDESRKEVDELGAIVGVTQREAQEGYADADAFRVAGGVLIGVGAAAVVASVLWLVLPNRGQNSTADPTPPVSVSPGLDGTLQLQGRF